MYIPTWNDTLHSCKAQIIGNTLQHTATHCSTLPHTVTHRNTPQQNTTRYISTRPHTQCNTLQHAATHCNTPQQNMRRYVPTSPHTHFNTLQHTATHRNKTWHATHQQGLTHCITIRHDILYSYATCGVATRGARLSSPFHITRHTFHRWRRSDWRITTAEISTSFHRSPRNFQTSFHGSPKNFKQFVTGVIGSPRHSKEWAEKPANLEIQIFSVWSPPWVVSLVSHVWMSHVPCMNQ